MLNYLPNLTSFELQHQANIQSDRLVATNAELYHMRYLQTREMTPRGEVMTLVGMGRLLLEGSEVNRLDLQNVYKVPYLTKNTPLSKNMLYIFVHPATTLSLSTFFPYLKKKSSPNCAISFIIYKIFHLNIQLTATNGCKP